MNTAIAYFCLVAAVSVVSFIAYGFDKRRAVKGGRRVPEQTLHVLALLGGWPGSFFWTAVVSAQDAKVLVPGRFLDHGHHAPLRRGVVGICVLLSNLALA